jgi:serine acetyltransferase
MWPEVGELEVRLASLAGAVVAKDVPDYDLVCGNPSMARGRVRECGEKQKPDGLCTACHNLWL